MWPAPLAFLRGEEPARTSTAHLNPFPTKDADNGTFTIQYFMPPHGDYSNSQSFGKLSFHRPPPHYHLFQDEYFKVTSGVGIWYLWGGRSIRLTKGEEIRVPRWKWHQFEADPRAGNEPLEVLVRFDAEAAEMEERFFRNVQSYIGDCTKAGKSPSVWQLMVFSMHFWMVIAVPSPGPEWLNFCISTVVTVVMACIGEFLLGYQASYTEYYKEKGKQG